MVWQVLTKGIENEDREQQSTKMKKKKKSDEAQWGH